MANCNNLFKKFNSNLNINKSKKERLISSRENLREKIRKYFSENHNEYTPRFYLQGSYALGTMIRTKDDTCDFDDGVYFSPKPEVSGTTFQGWVKKAVEEVTEESPEHRAKCIRIVFKGDYDIDLPIYYIEENNESKFFLAVKNKDWELSDPKEFKDWFESKKDAENQLLRIVRYLKAWCDTCLKKMPSGLSMTVLAVNNICYETRDDKSFLKTIKKIKMSLEESWECIMPTTPQDDLFENYTGSKEYFFERLDALIADGNAAIESEENQLTASKLWSKHLGKYFPEGEDANVDEKQKQLMLKALLLQDRNADTSSDGLIVEKGKGVTTNKEHKFYGNE